MKNGEIKSDKDAQNFIGQSNKEYKSSVIGNTESAIRANIIKSHPVDSTKSEDAANNAARKKLNGKTPYIDNTKKIRINGTVIN